MATAALITVAPGDTPRRRLRTAETAGRSAHMLTHVALLPELLPVDSRHVFLDAEAVHARYGIARTAGYELTRDLQALQCAPGRWRLADLLVFEEAKAAAAIRYLMDGLPEPLRDSDPAACPASVTGPVRAPRVATSAPPPPCTPVVPVAAPGIPPRSPRRRKTTA